MAHPVTASCFGCTKQPSSLYQIFMAWCWLLCAVKTCSSYWVAIIKAVCGWTTSLLLRVLANTIGMSNLRFILIINLLLGHLSSLSCSICKVTLSSQCFATSNVVKGQGTWTNLQCFDYIKLVAMDVKVSGCESELKMGEEPVTRIPYSNSAVV